MFVYFGPSISTVNPLFGSPSGGTSVTISGNNFNSATSVKFGNAPVQILSNTNNSLTVSSPSEHSAGSPEVNVCVTTQAGQDCTGRNVGNPSDQQFDYQPDLRSATNASGPWTGGTAVTLRGLNFTGATQVMFGSVAVPVSPSSDTRIVVNAPPWPGPGSTTQPEIVVQNTVGNSDHNGVTYNYTMPPAPNVSGVSPVSTSAVGGPVTVSGSHFLTGFTPTVQFGGSPCSSVTVVDDNTINCTAPPGLPGTSVDVSVTTIGGTGTKTNGFSYG
jgi:hypothetical protein